MINTEEMEGFFGIEEANKLACKSNGKKNRCQARFNYSHPKVYNPLTKIFINIAHPAGVAG
jgi:hypothetical protein